MNYSKTLLLRPTSFYIKYFRLHVSVMFFIEERYIWDAIFVIFMKNKDE